MVEHHVEDSLFGVCVNTLQINVDGSEPRAGLAAGPAGKAAKMAEIFHAHGDPDIVTLTEAQVEASQLFANSIGYQYGVTGEGANRIVTLWNGNLFELVHEPGVAAHGLPGVTQGYLGKYQHAFLKHTASNKVLSYSSAHMPHKSHKNASWVALRGNVVTFTESTDALLLVGDFNSKPSDVSVGLFYVTSIFLTF